MSFRPALISAVALLAVLTACRPAKVANYQTPKEALPTAPVPPADTAAPDAGMDMASIPVPTGSDDLTWTAPAHWTVKASGPMRKGSYAITGPEGEADLSITAFPGDTGGLLANINRWRGQLLLPPIGPGELTTHVADLEANGLHFGIVDFAGTANGVPTRTTGALLSRTGETWFFKLMGPDDLVAREKAALIAFLRTVKAAP